MFKRLIFFSVSVLSCIVHTADNKSSVRDGKNRVNRFWCKHKLSYSLVRDTYSKLKRLEKKSPNALKELLQIACDPNCFVDHLDNAEQLRLIGLVDEGRAYSRRFLIHSDVAKVINKLVYLENFMGEERASVSDPAMIFLYWPEG